MQVPPANIDDNEYDDADVRDDDDEPYNDDGEK